MKHYDQLKKDDNSNYVFAANISDIKAAGGCLSVQIQKYTIAVFYYNFKVHVIYNRYSHMFSSKPRHCQRWHSYLSLVSCIF